MSQSGDRPCGKGVTSLCWGLESPPFRYVNCITNTWLFTVIFSLIGHQKLPTEYDRCSKIINVQFICRKMTQSRNPKCNPFSRDSLSNHLIQAWYNIEKHSTKSDVEKVSRVAVTSDVWTSICQENYIIVTAHHITEGRMNQRVLKTKANY